MIEEVHIVTNYHICIKFLKIYTHVIKILIKTYIATKNKIFEI